MGNYGSKKKYFNELKGVNSRLDDIQAGFLSVKLKKLDHDNDKRRAIARIYDEQINNTLIIKPKWSGSKDHVFHLYVIKCAHRNALQDYLKSRGVETLIHYPISTHKQVAFKSWNKINLPITESLQNEVLSLPISPVLKKNDAKRIAEYINQFKINNE